MISYRIERFYSDLRRKLDLSFRYSNLKNLKYVILIMVIGFNLGFFFFSLMLSENFYRYI